MATRERARCLLGDTVKNGDVEESPFAGALAAILNSWLRAGSIPSEPRRAVVSSGAYVVHLSRRVPHVMLHHDDMGLVLKADVCTRERVGCCRRLVAAGARPNVWWRRRTQGPSGRLSRHRGLSIRPLVLSLHQHLGLRRLPYSACCVYNIVALFLATEIE